MIPVRITLDIADCQMLLDIFAMIEESHGLTGDMANLHKHLKEQLEPILNLAEVTRK